MPTRPSVRPARPKTYSLDKPPTDRFGRARRAATDRRKLWELTKPEYDWLASLPCDYCGAPTGTGIGLDRLDNGQGYTLANVAPCCGRCNKARGGSFTPAEFHRIVELLDWRVP